MGDESMPTNVGSEMSVVREPGVLAGSIYLPDGWQDMTEEELADRWKGPPSLAVAGFVHHLKFRDVAL